MRAKERVVWMSDFEGNNGRDSWKGRGDRREAFSLSPRLQGLFDRVPPHSEEAEKSLLGSMLLDHRVIPDVLQFVGRADAFYREAHAAVFDAILKVYNERNSGDIVQILQILQDQETLDDVGGKGYLIELAESVPSAVNAPHYAKIVRDKSQLRELIEAAGQILFDAYHSGDAVGDQARQVLDEAEQRIFKIVEKTVGGDSEDLGTLLQQTLDILDANFKHGRQITGLSTGFHELDDITNGLQPGELIIVAARPSMGKTAFALNLAEQIAISGQSGKHAPVAFFSLEMSRQSVTQRMLSAHSGVDSHKMRKNLLQHSDFDRLVESCSVLSEAPIYIDDTPGLTVLQLRAKARRMVAQHGVKCLLIDYLQLMTAPHAAREGRQQEVSTMSRNVKALARELNVPVICLAQLNRGAEQREGHRPRMADLRESGSIEQDADVIMLLHREEYYHLNDPDWPLDNPEKVGQAEVIIAKQRNGPTGTVELTWDGRTTRFKDRAVGYGGGGGGGGGQSRGGEVQTRKVDFSPGSRSGPVEQHRDGGGPDKPWEDEDISDIPV